jgi:5'-3' exonuclease
MAREREGSVDVHLLDGTYELFRAFFGAPSRRVGGQEVGAARTLLLSLNAWLRKGQVTHVACAFDHVIESFRNDLYAGYKTGEGMEPDLYSQFGLAEECVAALGITVWPMVPFEADDALAAAAHQLRSDKQVKRVYLCSPDKDLAQCVDGRRIVMLDRFKDVELDADGVLAKFGVKPEQIPDYLALVGDTADGVPGVDGFGAKAAAAVLTAHGSLEKIPKNAAQWACKVRGAERLAANLAAAGKAVSLYKQLTTLRTDVPIDASPKALAWQGADRQAIERLAQKFDDAELASRIVRFKD